MSCEFLRTPDGVLVECLGIDTMWSIGSGTATVTGPSASKRRTEAVTVGEERLELEDEPEVGVGDRVSAL
jgi:hypothetical protein